MKLTVVSSENSRDIVEWKLRIRVADFKNKKILLNEILLQYNPLYIIPILNNIICIQTKVIFK